MNYIIENWDMISAIIVGLYAVVRTAVLMTPTKSDDAALDTARGLWRKLLVILSNIIGLDTQQGRRAK